MSELAGLKTLVTVAKAGSFARAARQLALSPAMIGRRIQTLEDQYGVKLIERTTRSQKLTSAGVTFLLRAEQIIDAFEELDELARSDTVLRGQELLEAEIVAVAEVRPLVRAGHVTARRCWCCASFHSPDCITAARTETACQTSIFRVYSAGNPKRSTSRPALR